MQLIGQKVHHKVFGDGAVSDFSDSIVTVRFGKEEKRFIYPDAFSRFLTLADSDKQAEIHSKYSKKLKDEEAEKQMAHENQERRRKIRTMKIIPNAQAAFSLDATCADEIFAAGEISAGVYLTGSAKGEPRVPSRLKPYSACILTAAPENEKAEGKRRIVGAFMVAEDFWGELCRDGLIKVHAVHKCLLPAKSTLSYWDYFEHDKAYSRWGKVPVKYFSNDVMRKILSDMVRKTAGTPEEAVMQAFYAHFCDVNRMGGKASLENITA